MNKENQDSHQMPRRRFLELVFKGVPAAVIMNYLRPLDILAQEPVQAPEQEPEQVITHDQYLQRILNSPDYSNPAFSSFKDNLRTANLLP